MSNNTPEAMTKQQRQCEEKRKRCSEKDIWYYKDNKGRLQKLGCNLYKGVFEEDEFKKRE